MHGTVREYFFILSDPGQVMARVYGHQNLTGIP